MFYFVTRQPEGFVTQKIIKPLVGFISGFKEFENVDRAVPVFSLSSAELHQAFMQDEALAKTKFEGKVIQVSGVVSSIASPTDTHRVVLLEVDGISNISCQMDPVFNERMKDIASGSSVRIKGFCSGIKRDDLLGSLDVLMNRCLVVK